LACYSYPEGVFPFVFIKRSSAVNVGAWLSKQGYQISIGSKNSPPIVLPCTEVYMAWKNFDTAPSANKARQLLASCEYGEVH